MGKGPIALPHRPDEDSQHQPQSNEEEQQQQVLLDDSQDMIGAIHGRGFVVGAAEFGTRHKGCSGRGRTLLFDSVIIVQQGFGGTGIEEQDIAIRSSLFPGMSIRTSNAATGSSGGGRCLTRCRCRRRRQCSDFQDGIEHSRFHGNSAVSSFVQLRYFFICGCVRSSEGCGVATTRLDSVLSFWSIASKLPTS